jgi:hypothetical protein
MILVISSVAFGGSRLRVPGTLKLVKPDALSMAGEQTTDLLFRHGEREQHVALHSSESRIT